MNEKKFKFDLVSDLHEDINNYYPQAPNEGSSVLVVAGDLCEYAHLKATDYASLKEFKQLYERVIYVPGNHEYYGSLYQMVNDKVAENCDKIGVDFLNPGTVEIAGENIAFVGAALFTDMNGEDPVTMHRIREMMADFTYIQYIDENMALSLGANGEPAGTWREGLPYGMVRTIKPQDYVKLHRKFRLYMENECERLAQIDKKVVLVTHHAMSQKSVMPRYEREFFMNGGYHSRMEDFFHKHKNVAVHCHGHMHDYIRYEVAATRVYCNPYGYNKYEPKSNYGPLQIEV